MTKKPNLIDIPGHLQTGVIYDDAIGVGDGIEPRTVVDFAKSFNLRQIVQTSAHDHELELKTSELMLKKPDLFLNFPVSSILDPESVGTARENEVRSYSRQFLNANEKSQILEEIRVHCLDISKSESLVADICLAADELITNAIYNAPHVLYAQPGPGAPRTAEHGQSPDLRPGEIFIGASGTRLILGCADAYGSLNPNHLINRLKSCYDNGVAESVNFGTGGAGIGTFIIFQSASSLYIGVAQSQRTVICCAFSLERRPKVRAAVPKNLHICADLDSST